MINQPYIKKKKINWKCNVKYINKNQSKSNKNKPQKQCEKSINIYEKSGKNDCKINQKSVERKT